MTEYFKLNENDRIGISKLTVMQWASYYSDFTLRINTSIVHIFLG